MRKEYLNIENGTVRFRILKPQVAEVPLTERYDRGVPQPKSQSQAQVRTCLPGREGFWHVFSTVNAGNMNRQWKESRQVF